MKYERLTERDWHKEKFYPTTDSERVIRKRLWDLENKIEQGTLIELPCKVGDTVYYETFINSRSQGIKPHKVIGFVLEVMTQDIGGFGCTSVPIRDFGKDVFLTYEEAEKRLKELQNKDS